MATRAAVLLGLLLALAAAPVQAQGTATFSGQARNGTAGAGAPAGDEVTVAAFQNGQPVVQRQTTVGPDGRFHVDGLPVGQDFAYAARIEHAGVGYYSGSVTLADGQLPPVGVTVYETTDDPGRVVVERHAIAVLRPDAAARAFDVLELVVLRNDGDRTWTPRSGGPSGPMGILRFSLPEGASDFRPGGSLAGEAVQFSDRGFGTEMPVLPGRNEASFAYRIRYGAGTYVLNKTLVYGTGEVSLQVPTEIAGVVVGLLETPAPASQQGRYRQFAATDLPARSTLAVHLSDLPGAPPPVLAPPARWVALALAAMAALAAAAYGLRPRPDGASTPAEDGLARALAWLEIARDRGELDDDAYRRGRAALLTDGA